MTSKKSYKIEYYNLKNHVMPIIKILHPDFHIINIIGCELLIIFLYNN